MEYKKLLIVLPSLDVGGAQSFVYKLCNSIKENKYEIHLICLRKSKSDIYIKKFAELNISILDLEKKKASLAFIPLVRYIRNLKPDIILTTIDNCEIITSIASLFYRKAKLIVRKASFPYGKKDKIIDLEFIPNMISDKIVVLTEEMRSYYLGKKYINNEKIQVIYNMIDKNEVISNIDNIPPNEYLNSSNIIKIIAVGRLVEQKRHELLIEAFDVLDKKYENLKLLIIGDGDRRYELEKMIIKKRLQDKIELVGYKKNPQSYIYYSDILALTSKFEGFPNILIESFCCHTPVVSINCSSGPKEIIKHKKNGMLANNKSELITYMEELIVNRKLRKQMAENAYVDVEKYSYENISNKYVKMFEGIGENYEL